MNTKHLLAIFGLASIMSLNVFAQATQNEGENSGKKCEMMCKENRDKMMQVHEKYNADIKTLTGKIAVLAAHQKTLINTLNPDFNAVKKNIDEIASVKYQLTEKMIDMKLEMKALMGEKMSCPMMAGKGKEMGMHRGGFGWFANNNKMERPPMQGKGDMMGMKSDEKMDMPMIGENEKSGSYKSGMGAHKGKSMRGMHMKKEMIITKGKGDRKSHGQMMAEFKSLPVATQEQIKKSMLDTRYENSQIENQITELKVMERNLFSAEKPDVKAIKANAKKISDLSAKIMTNSAKSRIDIFNSLPEDVRKKIVSSH